MMYHLRAKYPKRQKPGEKFGSNMDHAFKLTQTEMGRGLMLWRKLDLEAKCSGDCGIGAEHSTTLNAIHVLAAAGLYQWTPCKDLISSRT